MADSSAAEQDGDNVIRIMVATDNHLGYGEKDAVRGEDSFTAFEEILELAVAEDVDMILLGGDLFHDAVPSQNAMHKCIELLRRYTFGDKLVSLEIVSDQAQCFYNAVNQSVNYEDPNLNIAIPVFSIHGNHDDPSGFGRLSSLDLLSTSGLINYFGRWTDLTKLEISPILIRKGESQLALYGLSHIHDGRLARLFKDFKVTFERAGPGGSDASTADAAEDDWFHLMVVHQNRADRGPKNYLPEELLPDFLHLVVWGHEHDCRIEPESNAKKGFYVSQPGSSVPTSLSEGEAKKKHVGLLEIYKTKFKLKELPLQSVRPFVYDSIVLPDKAEELGLNEGDASTKVYKFARERVESMIEKAKAQLTGHPKQPELPLIRLRLLYTDESCMFNTIRFSQMFSTRVANAQDVVQFSKLVKRTKGENVQLDKEAMRRALEAENATRVEELVDRYFEEAKTKKPLKLLHSKALAEMTYRLVERRDANAAENIVKFYREKAVEHLMESMPNEESIDDELQNFRERYKHEDLLRMLDARGVKTKNESSVFASKDDANGSTAAAAGRGTRGTRGRGAARGRAAATRAKPQLDASVNNSRSSGRQQTLASSVRGAKNVPPYVISDDSD
ncbi:double-strand break repair protein MRE11 [Drosophila guanche]|uniref:Double-strand break repair protein n=1 Tax=Drosophila guanche TaxID=7266 RepID=A0A3B0JAY6_DROGU|nr:double-strand break repair protein MRE11 [Drosophila guanche]SPP79507.1 blast:Double-strand break repair protein MRE11 [Drosophila guanche]